jgi:hypothetical protein
MRHKTPPGRPAAQRREVLPSDTYEAARITLELWRTGAATRDHLSAALRDRRSPSRAKDKDSGTRLRDVVFEALIQLLVGAAAPWALDEIPE